MKVKPKKQEVQANEDALDHFSKWMSPKVSDWEQRMAEEAYEHIVVEGRDQELSEEDEYAMFEDWTKENNLENKYREHVRNLVNTYMDEQMDRYNAGKISLEILQQRTAWISSCLYV